MRRAILVTTGTVVGVASVVIYKPSERLAVSNLSVMSLTPAASQVTSTSASPTATSSAAASSPAATPTSTRKARAKRHKATSAATHKAKARAKARTTARATAKATATTTAKPAPSGAFANANGTYHSPTEQVVSHGRYYGDATIAVTVSSRRITDITFNETGGNFQFADAVQQYLVPEIIKQQNVSVGIVSGATGSSMALINGLNAVLRKA